MPMYEYECGKDGNNCRRSYHIIMPGDLNSGTEIPQTIDCGTCGETANRVASDFNFKKTGGMSVETKVEEFIDGARQLERAVNHVVGDFVATFAGGRVIETKEK